MATTTIKNQVNFDGRTFSTTRTLENDGVNKKNPTVPAAKTGSLTVRTDNDTGTITGQNGHGVTTGAKLDIYWDGGSRYNVTAGTVSGNSIPFDLGSGDNLPPAATALTIKVPQSEVFAIDGDQMTCLVVSSKKNARVTFLDDADAVLTSIEVEANKAYIWDSDSGVTNPLAGAVAASVKLSHADSTAAQEVFVGVMYN